MNIKNSTTIRVIASCFLCSVFLTPAVWSVSGSQRSSGSSQKAAGEGQQPSGSCELPPNNAYDTTVQYVETFYPLWFTYNQAVEPNNLVGPERVSPLYHSVVMINDDTVYCSAFLNLVDGDTQTPMILTVPSTVSPDTCSADTSVTYSILILSPYGDVEPLATDPCAGPTPVPLIPHGAPPIPGGAYALVGPGYIDDPPIPPTIPIVHMPWNYPTIIFRSDKYHSFTEPPNPPDYVNQISQSYQFRSLLQLQTLSDWQECPIGGFADVKTEFPDFSVPYKTAADAEIAEHPIAFLHELQTAVASPRTPPNTCAQALAAQFDALFGDGNWKDHSDFGQGAQDAHAEIVNNYVNGHQVPGTNWTHFTNIGNWDPDDISISNAIDRSSITEFCQFCNDINSAGYYHAFRDGAGRALNGNNPHGYVLTFPAATPYPGPETTRFWSLTAYTPQAIELIPNSINRYEVASYSGAHLNPDGSLSIYMATEPPVGIPIENWLPVGKGPFNVVLRDYGPLTPGSVVCNEYIPPAIERLP
jgi:hypothetical protein